MVRKRDAYLSSFSLTQQLDKQYWHIDDGLYNALDNADLKEIMSLLVKRIEKNEGVEIAEAYAIIHDKDKREVWSDTLMTTVVEYKPVHIHASFKFKKDKNNEATIYNIADWVGVESNYIEKPKSGRYSWDNQLAYLIHAKDSEKFQYNPDEVYSYGTGDNYKTIYMERHQAWVRGGATKKREEHMLSIDWLEKEILDGNISKSEIMLSDDLYRICASNKRRVDDAFEMLGERKIYQAMKRLSQGELKTKVIYVMGESDSGKSTFVKERVKQLMYEAQLEGKRWECCYASGKNPVDAYRGEEILFMDDVRGNTMRPDDWLRLLDPYNATPTSARYKNRTVVAEYIFITSTLTPVEFFNSGKGSNGIVEAMDQFLRRLYRVVQVIKYPEDVRVYLPEKGEQSVWYTAGYDSVPSRYKLECVGQVKDMNTALDEKPTIVNGTVDEGQKFYSEKKENHWG